MKQQYLHWIFIDVKYKEQMTIFVCLLLYECNVVMWANLHEALLCFTGLHNYLHLYNNKHTQIFIYSLNVSGMFD